MRITNLKIREAKKLARAKGWDLYWLDRKMAAIEVLDPDYCTEPSVVLQNMGTFFSACNLDRSLDLPHEGTVESQEHLLEIVRALPNLVPEPTPEPAQEPAQEEEAEWEEESIARSLMASNPSFKEAVEAGPLSPEWKVASRSWSSDILEALANKEALEEAKARGLVIEANLKALEEAKEERLQAQIRFGVESSQHLKASASCCTALATLRFSQGCREAGQLLLREAGTFRNEVRAIELAREDLEGGLSRSAFYTLSAALGEPRAREAFRALVAAQSANISSPEIAEVTQENKTLTVHDLMPGATCSGAFCTVYFNPEALEIYSFSGVGNGMPMAAFHGRHMYLGNIPVQAASTEELEDSFREMEETFRFIAEGYSEEWDGSNHRGYLSEEASDALEGITEYTFEVPTFWDAGEWLSPAWREILDELLETEDNLDEWAKDMAQAGLGEGVHLDESDVKSYGIKLLEELIEEDEEDEDEAERVSKAKELLTTA